jgi:hypothetical protein
MDRLRALILLKECTGDDLWSPEYCRQQRIPEVWIDELCDCFESGFDHDLQTIYVDGQPTNQYLGIRDVDLALKLGHFLGVPVSRLKAQSLSRSGLVTAIQQAAEE